jgi:hypothetical protein
MAYLKPKFKGNGNKESPHFRPFLIEYASDRCLPSSPLKEVSFKHILNGLTSFTDTPNLMRILYNTALLTVIGLLKIYNYLITLPLFLQYLTNAKYLISS